VNHLAWRVMNEIVANKNWGVAMALLKTRVIAWKRALYQAMRHEHGLEVKQAVAFCAAFSGRNCFITGAGGCGKSHVVNLLKTAISTARGGVAVLAPTRVAAERICGQTYHSWAGFRPRRITLMDIEYPSIHPSRPEDASPPANDEDEDASAMLENDCVFVPVKNDFARDRVQSVETIILDEVSMVSPFHFDCLRKVVHKYTNRSVQWILAGDFCQLPSILKSGSIEHRAHAQKLTKRFVFETNAWDDLDIFSVELNVNRRSSTNLEFCTILASARLGLRSFHDVVALRAVVQKLKQITANSLETPQFGIFPTRQAPRYAPAQPNCKMADDTHLASLPTPLFFLHSVDKPTSRGAVCTSLPAEIEVKMGESLCVTRGPQRGKIGTLREVCPDHLILETETGDRVRIGRFEAMQLKTDRRRNEVAWRSQYMVRLSFGLTVHGVQGKSLRRFLVGCAGFWEHGQAYVALSRATDPALMQLLDIEKLEFICDQRVRCFYLNLAARALPGWAIELS